LVFAIVSNPNIVATIAWWVGFSFTIAAIFCIAWMYWMRNEAQMKKERVELIIGNWETMLFKSLENNQPKNLSFWKTSLKKKKNRNNFKPSEVCIDEHEIERHKYLIEEDLTQFLLLWNYVHESLRGKSKSKLNLLGKELNLAEKARNLSKKRNLKQKLLAIETLGNLQDSNSWTLLDALANDKNPIISLWTVTALFRINKEKALKQYFHLIAEREDWSPVFVAKLLKELTSDFISKPLTDLIGDSFYSQIPDRQLARLVSYLSLAHSYDYNPLINQILNESNQQEVLMACLRLVNSEEMIPRIRKLAKDDRWQIRMQVVLALSKFGSENDLDILITALNDIEWWVRYRAAYAISSMPTISEEYIIELSNTLPNEFSRDILKQVLAEIKFQCLTQPSYNTLSR
jgi:hypothetical protein